MNRYDLWGSLSLNKTIKPCLEVLQFPLNPLNNLHFRDPARSCFLYSTLNALFSEKLALIPFSWSHKCLDYPLFAHWLEYWLNYRFEGSTSRQVTLTAPDPSSSSYLYLSHISHNAVDNGGLWAVRGRHVELQPGQLCVRHRYRAILICELCNCWSQDLLPRWTDLDACLSSSGIVASSLSILTVTHPLRNSFLTTVVSVAFLPLKVVIVLTKI